MYEGFERIEIPISDPEGLLVGRHTEHRFNPRETWPRSCSNVVRMQGLPCGHYPSERAPHQTYRELRDFFAARP